MTYTEAFRDFADTLSKQYERSEAWKMTEMIFEKLLGWDKTDLVKKGDTKITIINQKKLDASRAELLAHKPIQYMLNESWFHGRKFFVDENVLIPRPETDELVNWIIADQKIRKPLPKNFIDIGTGSGCIPVSLKKSFPRADVMGIDISTGALQVAAQNAAAHEADIELMLVDFLNKDEWEKLQKYDVIISNPPYIPEKDKASMNKNVVEYEPHEALFVPDDNALLYYETIAEFARDHLQKNGSIFMEIHEDMGIDTYKLFTRKGFSNIELKKDMQGKDRMVKAMK